MGIQAAGQHSQQEGTEPRHGRLQVIAQSLYSFNCGGTAQDLRCQSFLLSPRSARKKCSAVGVYWPYSPSLAHHTDGRLRQGCNGCAAGHNPLPACLQQLRLLVAGQKHWRQ